MNKKAILAVSTITIIILAIVGFVLAAPYGNANTVDYKDQFAVGETVVLEWHSSVGNVHIWLQKDDAPVAGYAWDEAAKSGQITVNPDLSPGTYEVWISTVVSGKAVVLNNPSAPFAFTVNGALAPPQETDTETITPSSGVANSTSTDTGVSVEVNLDRFSIRPGTLVTITTQYYGATQPPDSGPAIGINGVFYEVFVTTNYPIDSATPVTISLTNDAITSTSQVQFWDGSTWITIAPVEFEGPHTLTFTLPLYQLQGTPLFVAPEYTLGALLAIVACFAAIGVFKARKHLPHNASISTRTF